ncbi:MAG: hypothetical protein JWR26_3454 [Pedosphaera sp.]|nr:hypothetical protein [Pedosphaera sp.]
MEDQTRHDLNADIENWRRELAAQGNLTAEVRRELETLLRDAIAGFQQRGLNNEESFWLACKRVGQPPQLGQEFAKADPAAVWRERVFWMTISLVGSYVFMTWKDLLATWLNPSSYGWTECVYLIPLFVLIGSVVMIRRGRIPNSGYLESMASWRLVCGLFVILTVTVLTAYLRSRNLPSGGEGIGGMMTMGYNMGMVLSWFGNAVWPAAMVLVLLLTLRRNRKMPKRA